MQESLAVAGAPASTQAVSRGDHEDELAFAGRGNVRSSETRHGGTIYEHERALLPDARIYGRARFHARLHEQAQRVNQLHLLCRPAPHVQ